MALHRLTIYDEPEAVTPKPNIPKTIGNIPPDTQEFRVAVHEAGHAITAWLCTAVVNINHITISDHGGQTNVTMTKKSLDAFWCDLVITLAGFAAEVTIYRNGRSGPMANDLLIARELANILIQNGANTSPWKKVSSGTLNFQKMFQQPLSENERQVIEAGYQHARYLLQQHLSSHHRLVVYLLRHRTVTEKEMETLFGKRTFIFTAGLFRDTFVGAP